MSEHYRITSHEDGSKTIQIFKNGDWQEVGITKGKTPTDTIKLAENMIREHANGSSFMIECKDEKCNSIDPPDVIVRNMGNGEEPSNFFQETRVLHVWVKYVLLVFLVVAINIGIYYYF